MRHNKGKCLPLSLKAVGKTSLLIEPQGKKSGGIFVSSPVKYKVISVIRTIIYFLLNFTVKKVVIKSHPTFNDNT